MALTKSAALKALVNKVKQKYKLEFDASTLIDETEIADYLKSKEASYRRFAEAYNALEFKLGGHPDYNYLTEPENIGKTENATIATFFLDLKNFTKYCCFLAPDDVYLAKSVVIESVIRVCQMYGGHLHEIPGDGVMFFFGRKDQEDIETTKQAIDAAADSMDLLENEIIPGYNDEDKYPDIYPKMGIDYGEVLWGAYGAAPNYETKATSFYVDIASKMMDRCKAREIAIGDSIRKFLEIEEEYISKTKSYDHNLTVDGENKSISYKIWLFNWRKYLKDGENGDIDLAKLGLLGVKGIQTISSKSKLRDAPLA